MSFERLLAASGRRVALGQSPAGIPLPPGGALACPAGGGYELRLLDDPSVVVASGMGSEVLHWNGVHGVNADDPRCSGMPLPDYGAPVDQGPLPGFQAQGVPLPAGAQGQPGGALVLTPAGGGATVSLPSGPGSTAGWAETYRPGEGDLSLLDEETVTEEPSTTAKLLAIGGMGAGIVLAVLLGTGAMGVK